MAGVWCAIIIVGCANKDFIMHWITKRGRNDTCWFSLSRSGIYFSRSVWLGSCPAPQVQEFPKVIIRVVKCPVFFNFFKNDTEGLILDL